MEWRSPGSLPTKLPPSWLEGSPAFLCNLVFGKVNHHVGVKHINMIARLQFLLLYIPMIPESPRWLVSKGRTSAALDVLMSIARVNKYSPNLWNYNKDPLNNDNDRMLESHSEQPHCKGWKCQELTSRLLAREFSKKGNNKKAKRKVDNWLIMFIAIT